MNDLIEALTILAKYQAPTRWPTNCSHDQLSIMGVSKGQVSEADSARLDELGFIWSDSDECWMSFRFGSA